MTATIAGIAIGLIGGWASAGIALAIHDGYFLELWHALKGSSNGE